MNNNERRLTTLLWLVVMLYAAWGYTASSTSLRLNAIESALEAAE